MRITMPQLGESVIEGTVGRWLKREGEQVERYEPLLEIITDKVNAEYPSPVAGTLTRILVAEGETVSVDTEIAEIETVSDAHTVAPDIDANQMQPTNQSQGEALDERGMVVAQVGAVETGGGRDRDEAGRRYSPAVRRLAEEHGINLSLVQGTGAGGRVSRRDVEAYIEKMTQAPAAPFIPEQPQQAPVAATVLTPPFTTPIAENAEPHVQPQADGDQLLPLTPMRRAIAEHMVRSVYTAPHVTTVVEVDMTPIVRYRERAREEFERREGVPLTYMPFVIRAVVEGIKQFPIINSSWTDQVIVLKKRINIGVAVGLEDGLVVPVIHDADGKSLVGLARAIHDLATRARAGTLRPEDVRGGTFTVNNPGTYGTLMSTPVISQPQAAILSTEAITKRPVVTSDDAIAIRSMMYISFSFDHRILDGMQAARFLGSVKQRLESFTPESTGM
ncbi:MAG: 2-oxo acid dehydrogenase subunit E2 [Chloroflexota bacterium]|nr:2-oxo acid dehydrogenase subunit E2 [Chloroflexota bacterium]